ncbi:ATPase [Methylomonas lenta]|uniref:Potassium-transporting ATPase potassium-binding subunit n=1 Tax=Methylomonas lenta TaxID=980561 RepID=A0A177N2F2_9GAMM|nr:potassium-transporting ATPase subunit KdpA [Methylomonas lenta]OAI11349.1 ATPase [Methylomonas lenta]
MTEQGLLQVTLYLAILLLLVRPLGGYMARVYLNAPPAGPSRWLTGIERGIYRLSSIDPDQEMCWPQYALAVLLFNLLGIVAVFVLERWQAILPLNPQGMAAIGVDSALNTAVSFATNTNWQGYGGETTLSYLTQMLGLTVQNFLSAASGMAVLVALIRGFSRHNAETIGNFWVDMTRSVLYILLPLSLVFAVILAGQGVLQNYAPYQTVTTVEAQNQAARQQTIAMGPVASQLAIKQLGTNGGGFFNVNSSHPFENPTPLSNFLEMLAILLIPAALCYSFGVMIGDTRQGWLILATMAAIFIPLVLLTVAAEQAGNPLLANPDVDQAASLTQAGGNMEGKETRFGIVNSALWAVVTTAASNGSVNAMHDSFTPLGGLAPMALMQLGEVVFGGVGSGLYGMIVFALVAVFIAGLMIGRTPEYLGKKIEAFEMKMAALVILIPPLLVLGGTALAVMLDVGKTSIFNPGAHGFSEVLYAFSSAGNNNGSAFAGLNANVPFYNLSLAIAMLIARYGLMVPVLAIAGSLAAKKSVPVGAGTLPTHTPLFGMLLLVVVVMVGALTFVPALALGPIVEHLQMIGLH